MNPIDETTLNGLRLSVIILHIGTDVMQRVLNRQIAKKGNGYTIEKYLKEKRRHHDELRDNHRIYKYQYELMYPLSDSTAQTSQNFDITLCVKILQEILQKPISTDKEPSLKKRRLRLT